MRSRVSLLVALLVSWLVYAPPAGAAASAPTITIAVLGPNGAPLAGADTSVYYLPLGTQTVAAQPQTLASGTTDPSGRFTGSVNQSIIQGLGVPTVGGQGSYNAMVVAWDPSGRYVAIGFEVLPYGAPFSDTIQAIPASGLETTAAASPRTTAMSALTILSGTTCSTCQADELHWLRVGVWNQAYGMKTDFTYQVGQGTSTQVATTACSSGGWCVGGWALEQDARGAKDQLPAVTNASVHKYMWADYWFREYLAVQCDHVCIHWYYWDPLYWEGDYGNPPSGVDTYSVPSFIATYAHVLLVGETITRSSGTQAHMGRLVQHRRGQLVLEGHV